jgi:hypothetical protein
MLACIIILLLKSFKYTSNSTVTNYIILDSYDEEDNLINRYIFLTLHTHLLIPS